MRMSKKFRPTPVAAAVLAALQAAGTAHAQQSQSVPSTQLPKISVEDQVDEGSYKAERASSAKFTQPLVDTPQTVTVLRKELMAEQGATNLSEALRNTPGITFQLGENGNTQSGDAIFMRGFDTQSSIFIDNIRDLGSAVRDVFNIEQVEIFKGPAGADNGRGATSGYVNLASKVPTESSIATGALSYGTNERRRISGDWNHELAGDQGIAFRLNVMGQDGGVAGRDVIERQSWGVAPSIAVGLGTATRIYAYSQHVRQENTPDGYVPTIGISDHQVPILAGAGITPEAVDPDNFYGLSSDYEDIDADMFTVRFEHDVSPDFTVRNVSRYGKSEQERVLTAPNQAPVITTATINNPELWTVRRSRQASFRENRVLTNQTNFTTNFRTGVFEHDLSGGVEFIYESQYTPTYTNLGTPVDANLYNPNPNDGFTVAPAIGRNGVYTDGNTTTSAAYAFDTLKLGESWQFSAGARFEHYNTDTDGASLSTAESNPTLPVGTLVPSQLGTAGDLFSWKVGALYKPAANGSVYVAFANSRKPPGSDNFTLNAGATNINNGALDPQKATNIELGTKWDLFDSRLAATAAVFKSENKNDIARTDPSDPLSVQQLGKKEVKGVELGLVGRITDVWQISSGVTYQDTEVKEGTSNPANNVDQNGSAINFSPKVFATVWTTYQLPFDLTVGGGVRYVDSQIRQINITPQPGGINDVPSYTVVDLFARYDVTEKINLQLNAYNVGDKEYVSMINNSGQRYGVGTPVSYLASVNFKF